MLFARICVWPYWGSDGRRSPRTSERPVASTASSILALTSPLALRAVIMAALVLLGQCAVARAQKTQKAQSTASSPAAQGLLLGAAWYPEQWPESRWDADLALMQKAHMHVVRVGEFAWTALEPSEGHYDFDWLERAINLAGRHGISVVLGTPSAGPPTWMTAKYPEVVATADNGTRYAGAVRNRFNWNSKRYREFVREIDERLAQRFGHNPNVIAWQIDNEYWTPTFDPETQARFHAWLAQRYGTLENLNRAWTTAYDNETYTAWDQVRLMYGTADNNPGLWLDSKRFMTETLREYQKVQIDAIRKYADPRQRITNNMMGWFDLFDHYPIAADLDFVAWDDPQVEGHWDPIRNGAAHDLMRGLKDGRNLWVMETTAGPRGAGDASVMLDKGEMRAAMWHDIGHGADLISYWQWRDALNGGEQNHGAIVDVDGEPDPIYSEMAQVGQEFEKAGPALAGTRVEARVAILHSYPSRWNIAWQRMNPKYDPVNALVSFYKPLHALGYSIDVVPPDRDLSRYGLVVAPALNLLTAAEAANLERYVRQGGHLVLGQRSAMKDEHDSRWPQRQPGPLAALLGARVEQFTALDAPVDVSGTWGAAKGQLFAEQLRPEANDVQVLMRYHAPRSWIDGEPAAVTRRVGAGSITYLGAWLDEDGMRRATEWMLHESGTKPDLLNAPAGVEVYRRVGQGREVFILDNDAREEETVTLPGAMRDVLSGKMVESVHLPVYGVAVVERTEAAR